MKMKLKLKFIVNGYNLQKNENQLNYRLYIILNDNIFIDKMIILLDVILIVKL